MIRVYTDMVADLFHHGHVELLRRAREFGDVLVVGIHSDATVGSYKRAPVMSMDERVSVVEACRYVDEVLPDAPLRITREWIDGHHIDLVVHGDDLDDATMASFYGVAQQMGIFRTIPYTPGVSTSEIIGRLYKGAGL